MNEAGYRLLSFSLKAAVAAIPGIGGFLSLVVSELETINKENRFKSVTTEIVDILRRDAKNYPPLRDEYMTDDLLRVFINTEQPAAWVKEKLENNDFNLSEKTLHVGNYLYFMNKRFVELNKKITDDDKSYILNFIYDLNCQIEGALILSNHLVATYYFSLSRFLNNVCKEPKIGLFYALKGLEIASTLRDKYSIFGGAVALCYEHQFAKAINSISDPVAQFKLMDSHINQLEGLLLELDGIDEASVNKQEDVQISGGFLDQFGDKSILIISTLSNLYQCYRAIGDLDRLAAYREMFTCYLDRLSLEAQSSWKALDELRAYYQIG